MAHSINNTNFLCTQSIYPSPLPSEKEPEETRSLDPYAENPPSDKGKEEDLPISRERKRPDGSRALIDQMLCPDLLHLIFQFATANHRDPNNLSAVRGVSKRWQWIFDVYNLHLKSRWEILQEQIQNPALRNSVGQIDQIVFIDRFVSEALASAICLPHSEPDESELASLNDRIEFAGPSWASRFSLLTQALRAQGAPIPQNRTIIGFEASVYEKLQQQLDSALETMWTPIQKQIDFEGMPISSNAHAIRYWLNDPANAEKIARISFLSLCNMNLTVLPPEIGNFIGLKFLLLSKNQLHNLPESIGELTQLLALDLFENQLHSVPESIGKLTQLKGLFLNENQLHSLPNSIENLTQLCKLRLEGNQLHNLPENIGKLTNLFMLHLSDSPLLSLPASIFNLTKLPWMAIYKDLLIFLLDTNFLKLASNKNLDFQQMKEKYLACSNHSCQTAFASLCQKIHFGKEGGDLKAAFNQLSPKLQMRLRKAVLSFSSSSSKAQADLFADRTAVVKGVIKATRKKWKSLSQQERMQSYWHVWDMAGRPQSGDPNWGETHAWDNIIRMIDAMELATQK